MTAVPQTPDQQQSGLDLVSGALGLQLDPAKIAVEGLRFKRAQLLEWNGAPLAQIVYLDAEDRPIAFCIRQASVGGPEGLTDASMLGMAATTWQSGEYGFIVIGPAEQEKIRKAADQLSRNLPA